MQTFLKILAVTSVLTAGSAYAQETANTEDGAETPATEETTQDEDNSVDGNNPGELGLSMGTAEGEAPAGDGTPQVGQQYVAEVSGDWEIRCVKTENGKDPCQLYQLLRDDNGNSVAEFSLFNLANAGEAVAGATIITPLETLLTQQISLSVDGGAARKYPFTFCAAIGCFARVGFTANDVGAFRAGNAGRLQIVPAGAPDQKVNLTMSLTGFTKGFERMSELNENAAAE